MKNRIVRMLRLLYIVLAYDIRTASITGESLTEKSVSGRADSQPARGRVARKSLAPAASPPSVATMCHERTLAEVSSTTAKFARRSNRQARQRLCTEFTGPTADRCAAARRGERGPLISSAARQSTTRPHRQVSSDHPSEGAS